MRIAVLMLVTSTAVVGCFDFGDESAHMGGPGPGGTAALGSGSPPGVPHEVVALHNDIVGIVRKVELMRAGRLKQASQAVMQEMFDAVTRDAAALRKLGYAADPPTFALRKL
jgi:hypothetical protein